MSSPRANAARSRACLPQSFRPRRSLGRLPAAGFPKTLNWHWIFFINLPLGLIALVGFAASFKPRGIRTSHQIDWLGAITLSLGIGALTLVTSLGGPQLWLDLARGAGPGRPDRGQPDRLCADRTARRRADPADVAVQDECVLGDLGHRLHRRCGDVRRHHLPADLSADRQGRHADRFGPDADPDDRRHPDSLDAGRAVYGHARANTGSCRWSGCPCCVSACFC